jgi:uncharacterized protein (DUF1330 family)
LAAYIIVTRESPVTDPAAMAEYSASNRAHAEDWRAAFGIEPLAVYGACETPEGDAPDGVLVLKFPSLAQAKAWYDSPAYQAVIPLREQAARWRVVIVDGLQA